MHNVYKKSSKKYFILAIFSAMVLLAYFNSQTMSMQSKNKTYKKSFNLKIEETVLPNTTIENTITTATTIEEVTTVPAVSTTVEIASNITVTTRVSIKTTTTDPYIPSVSSIEISGRNGPSHDMTTLVGCISWYESNWGLDPNVFQFTQETWQTYGGVGYPSKASYSEQEAIFWLAWEDAGEQHWAAQKGRCF